MRMKVITVRGQMWSQSVDRRGKFSYIILQLVYNNKLMQPFVGSQKQHSMKIFLILLLQIMKLTLGLLLFFLTTITYFKSRNL